MSLHGLLSTPHTYDRFFLFHTFCHAMFDFKCRTCFNPIALRKAKIVYNFSFSESNKFKVLEVSIWIFREAYSIIKWFLFFLLMFRMTSSDDSFTILCHHLYNPYARKKVLHTCWIFLQNWALSEKTDKKEVLESYSFSFHESHHLIWTYFQHHKKAKLSDVMM